MTTKARDINAISIDRVDSSLGYLKTNVILVCHWVNLGRGKYCSPEQFLAILRSLKLAQPSTALKALFHY